MDDWLVVAENNDSPCALKAALGKSGIGEGSALRHLPGRAVPPRRCRFYIAEDCDLMAACR